MYVVTVDGDDRAWMAAAAASAPPDDDGVVWSSSVMKPMYVMASRSVSIRDKRFSYANVGTFRRSLSNASFRLYMRLRSRMLAARRCASVATRRRIFLADADADADDFCEPPLPLPLPPPPPLLPPPPLREQMTHANLIFIAIIFVLYFYIKKGPDRVTRTLSSILFNCYMKKTLVKTKLPMNKIEVGEELFSVICFVDDMVIVYARNHKIQVEMYFGFRSLVRWNEFNYLGV